MRTIKLLIAYDGTDFCGWQRQAGQDIPSQKARSVQAVIEAALEQMHTRPVALAGSGRTDSGVHAAGQVAHFHTDIDSIPPDRFVPALNGLLPQDIRILDAAAVRPDFHARFDARMRTYRYHFICGRRALPHESRYALQLWQMPSIDLLNAYCRLLVGERDCSIFAGAGDASLSRSRYIFHAAFFVEGNRLIFEISANAFLWKMVRSIAGTFLHYGERNTPPERLRDIIASGDRSLAGPTLPPQGLFLWKVDYYVANGQ
ncbi:MAG: tRNA pseudouridine(38-40) synthase TruA [Treponema sp.]|nr:tRNA pseudouridine(38-40) synthase TruA [Treponema sp.]